MNRAQKGGEIGANGERYAGGTFLPRTRLPKRGAAAGRGTGRVLIAPGVFGVAPDGMRAIFAGIRSVVVVAGDGTISPLPASHPFWAADPEYREVVGADCVLWNAGERFK